MLTTSECINELATALSAFQGEVQNAAKNSKNPFFNSTYADLGEVLNVARPLLGKHGLALVQSPNFSGTKEEGFVTVVSVLTHASGQWIRDELCTPVFATTGKSGKTELVSAQTVGSAITYCRRYAAAALLGISQQDDDGNSTSGKDAPGNAREAKTVAPAWTAEDEKEFATVIGVIRGHFHVQNKFDEFEEFTAKVVESKTKFPGTILLEMLRKREKEFKAKADKFVASAIKEPKQPALLEE
jgi:hypothetical protein